jgi:hypothetical protein
VPAWEVVEIGGQLYWGSYRLACHVAAMPRGPRRVWLGRNWRRMQPVTTEQDGKHQRLRLVSGTHDLPRSR